MICRVSSRTTHAGDVFDPARANEVTSYPDRPLGPRVIGHWPVLDELGDQHTVWPFATWARYLEVPSQEWPDAVGPRGADDRAAIFHFNVRLHPADRRLTDAEWTTVIHHLAHTAGITTSNGGGEYRWMAIRTAPGQADFIANLINDSDGTWARPPHQLHQRLHSASRDCETRLRLIPAAPDPGRHPADVAVHQDRERGITITVHTHRTQVMADVEEAGFTLQDDQRYILPTGTPTDEAKRRAAALVGNLRSGGVSVLLDPDLYHDAEGTLGAGAVPTGTALLTGQITHARRPAQLAGLISAITDDRLGDLPRLRRFAETAAAWAGARTGPVAGDAEHRLEWIARRLHGIEEDLHTVAQILTEPPATPRHAAGSPPPVAGNLPPGPPRR